MQPYPYFAEGNNRHGGKNMYWQNNSEFFEIVVRPYLEPFISLIQHTWQVMTAGIVYTFILMTTFATTLFTTPEIWWKGLAILIMFDFIAGHIRVLSDPLVKFDIKRWGRTAYKIASYTIAGLSITAGANMFPETLGWTQYVAFAVLSGMEIYSILRNLKMLDLLGALFETAFKQYGPDTLDAFKDRYEQKKDETRMEDYIEEKRRDKK